jgi:hypothetical protein
MTPEQLRYFKRLQKHTSHPLTVESNSAASGVEAGPITILTSFPSMRLTISTAGQLVEVEPVGFARSGASEDRSLIGGDVGSTPEGREERTPAVLASSARSPISVQALLRFQWQEPAVRSAEIPEENLASLLIFMQARQLIYKRRSAGEPPPWTDDLILRNYKFENIYREQDKETIWLKQNWREPYRDHPNLWLAVALFRWVGWSPALAEIGFPEVWNPDRVKAILESRIARGEKTFTSAYRADPTSGVNGRGTKAGYIVDHILDPVYRAVQGGPNPPPFAAPEPWCGRSLEQSHRWFIGFPGWGGDGFMSTK